MNKARNTSPKRHSNKNFPASSMTSPRWSMRRFNRPQTPKRTLEDRRLDQEISSVQFQPGAVLLRVGEFSISKKKSEQNRLTAEFADNQPYQSPLQQFSALKGTPSPATPDFREPELSFAFLEPGFETPHRSYQKDQTPPQAPLNSENRSWRNRLSCLPM